MKTTTLINKEDKLVVLTGAGISAESGIKTFRDSDGLWENHSIEDVATPSAFTRDPSLVWDFYAARYNQILEVKPNPGHYALKQLEDHLGDNFLLITQNIDGLHRLAGSKNVLEMHGSIDKCYCNKCEKTISTADVIAHRPASNSKTERYPSILKNKHQWFKCSKCSGLNRPDIIWFGEIPYHLDEIIARLRECTIFLVAGTSGVVYPAAQFLLMAKQHGAKTIGINLDAPMNVDFIEEFHQGKSGDILPSLVKKWIE